MLTAGHFTFPLSVRTGVASDGIIKSTAATHRAVTQHHDMSVVGFHAVQKRCRGQIDSVPNHDMPRYQATSTGAAGKTARHSAALQVSLRTRRLMPPATGRNFLCPGYQCEMMRGRFRENRPCRTTRSTPSAL